MLSSLASRRRRFPRASNDKTLRIDRLMKMHRSCYVLVQAAAHADSKVSEVFAALQSRYPDDTENNSSLIVCNVEERSQTCIRCKTCSCLNISGPELNQYQAGNKYLFSRLNLVPVHHASEAVQCMQDIIQVVDKPMSQALLAGVEQIVGSGTLVEHCKQNALRHIGLTEHECVVLMDGIGSLADIARASEESLLDCSLSTSSSARVLNFLRAPLRAPDELLL